MSRLEVLVPMKPLASAKSRLAPAVPDLRRQALALLLLQRVLDAARHAVGADACRVVGGDAVVRQVALSAGCAWDPEKGNDLNTSLWLAMGARFKEGAAATLFLPADLPQATPGDVTAVVAASVGLSRPVGVRASGDGGTNALLLPTACAFPPALGEQSFRRHEELAVARGAPLETPLAPGLAFDIDTPEDLAWAETTVTGFTGEADRWEEWLRRRGVGPSPQTERAALTDSPALPGEDHG